MAVWKVGEAWPAGAANLLCWNIPARLLLDAFRGDDRYAIEDGPPIDGDDGQGATLILVLRSRERMPAY